MTEKQYEQAVAINDQIKKLSAIKEAIGAKKVKLTFVDDRVFNLPTPSSNQLDEGLLNGFVDAHSQKIIEEIDEKIAYLKKEIEAL